MEGNSVTSFENLCKIFEMRIKLDKEKGVKTSLDVLTNYEKYSKKIDAIYNGEFQKELKPLISPAVTLEKEEDRLRRLIKLLEDRLDRRVELEDRFYDSTGKYISGLQVIVSESELEEKKNRLSIISNYLETSREIESVNNSLGKLKDSLAKEEEKKKEYEDKNRLMEDELYSSFTKIVKEDDYYRDINEDEINDRLDEIRSKVSETSETLDITRESVGSLVNSGLEDDYTSYIEEAEKNYYSYKNKEIILKIYKLIINFEDDFKLICSKREKINELIDEKNNLRTSLTIDTEDELLSFEKILLLQIKTLDAEKEILENIANYTSRINFKEERLEELKEANNSSDTLAILREYGLVETYDCEVTSEEVLEDPEVDNLLASDVNLSIAQKVYDPYRIVEVKDYPRSLNVGLAKLKGESVREKVNKKLNPREDSDINYLEENIDSDKAVGIDSLENKVSVDSFNSDIEGNTSSETNIVDNPVWTIPTELEPQTIDLNSQNPGSLPVWENVKPTFNAPEIPDKKDEIESIDIAEASSDSGMFWVPVSDSKLDTNDFSNLNISNNGFNETNTFDFPNMNN